MTYCFASDNISNESILLIGSECYKILLTTRGISFISLNGKIALAYLYYIKEKETMDRVNAKYISFSGMVFMYGNMQIIAEKSNDKVILSKFVGSDGAFEVTEEKNINIEVFDEILKTIDTLECAMTQSEEENAFIAKEEEEISGAYEWELSVCDEKDNILFCLQGINPESITFNKVNEALFLIIFLYFLIFIFHRFCPMGQKPLRYLRGGFF